MANTFTKTLQDIYDTGYAIIKQPESSTAYDRDNFFLPKINESQNDVIDGGLVNPLNPNDVISKINLPFNNGTEFFSSVGNTSTTALAVVGATTLDADTTNYPTTGTIWLEGDVITYTGTLSTQFTGVTGINFAHDSGKKIRLMYSLPTNFGQLNRIFYKNIYTLVPIDQRDLVTNQYNQQSFVYKLNNDDDFGYNNEFYYSIIDNTYLLPLTPSETGKAIRFEYEKETTELVLVNPGTQTLNVPDKYALQTIPHLAVGKMMIERGEVDEGTKLFLTGFNNVKKMYKYFNNQKQELLYNQRVRTQKDTRINI